MPPTSYEVTLTCAGLVKASDLIAKTFTHRFGLILDATFPMTPPTIIWKTPIFHPNFSPPHVCTGDIWYPALSLAQLCTSLCEHVQYKYFNIYDPLDMDAATWLHAFLQTDNPEIPIDRRPVIDPEFSLDVHLRTQE